jgi:hypothetical protein
MSRSVAVALILAALGCVGVEAQVRPPVIDVHFHGGEPIAPWLERMDELGIERTVLAAYPEQLAEWGPQDSRLMPSLMFPCITQFVPQCFPGDELLPDIAWLRAEVEAGRIAMLGEVVTELFGLYPNDPALEPYFSLAEEFDIPFGLHMGPGPVWAVTDRSIYHEFPNFDIRAGNPLEIEEVMRRHPDLRLFIMHAGWPMLDELLTVLWHNPNVYVELGHLQIAISRPEYHGYLRRIVDAGYGDRIMYGSDVGLDDFGSGIDAILDADFLSEGQKRDILYNNAARFLRLEN